MHLADAQDPIFSQFYNAPIQLNPALVGLSNTPNLTLNYRDQWSGWPQAYKTYSAAFDQYFDYLNSGLGGQILADDAGDGIIKTIKISGVYSYHLQLSKHWRARTGLEVGVIQSRLDWDRLIFYDQISVGIVEGSPGGIIVPTLENRPENLNNLFLDLSMGAMLYSDNFFVGLALKHINNPSDKYRASNQSVYTGLPMRISVHAGGEIDLDGYNNEGFGSFIAPSILFAKQGGSSQLNAGALINRENIFAGAWLRYDFNNLDAAIFSAGWRTQMLKISYSFDLTLSSATLSRTTGSHELGIQISFGGTNPGQSRYEDCFSIFR